MIKDGQVLIVDEFHRPPDAGAALERRAAPGDRGEEGVRIERENQTLAASPGAARRSSAAPASGGR